MIRWFSKVVLRLLPQRTITTLVGAFARTPFSRILISTFIRRYRIDVRDSLMEVKDFGSLTEFFSRSLKPGARPLEVPGVTSPVDGRVTEFGSVADGTLVQAKGSTYTLEALLGDSSTAQRFVGGHYITLYLSPRDYHRVHMPLKGAVVQWRHVPGTLYPVNSLGVNHVEGLFTKNERLISFIRTPHGHFAVVKVGAMIVGSIRSRYGPARVNAFRRHRWSMTGSDVRLDLEQGDELGYFEFGSTVILLFEPGIVHSFAVHPGQKVQMGQRIATTMLPRNPAAH